MRIPIVPSPAFVRGNNAKILTLLDWDRKLDRKYSIATRAVVEFRSKYFEGNYSRLRSPAAVTRTSKARACFDSLLYNKLFD